MALSHTGLTSRSYIAQQYNAHLDPVLGPHLRRAQSAIEPYTTAFYVRVYLPYIRPTLEKILPAVVLKPDPPRSFWALISEILPSMEGGHVAERRGQMDDAYAKVAKEKTRATQSIASMASKASKAASSATGSAKDAATFDRAEMDRTREALRKRIDDQGQKAYAQLQDKVRYSC